MKAFFEITVIGFALLLELIIGNMGFSARLTAYVLFYIASADSPRNALIGAVAAGAVSDLLLHRPVLLTPFLLIFSLAAGWCLRRKHTNHLLETALPGMAIGIANTLGDALFLLWTDRSIHSSGTLLWQLLFHGAAGLLVFPGIVYLLDSISGALDLPRCLDNSRTSLEHRRWGSRPRTVKERTVNPDRRRKR